MKTLVILTFCFAGDHDAVLAMLLFPRMTWKADILIGQVDEKVIDLMIAAVKRV